MKKMNVLRAAAILALLCSVSSCGSGGTGGKDASYVYTTVKAERRPVTTKEEYAATIEGRQDVEIMPQIQGTIVRQCIVEGERVRKGQTLFVINPIPYEAEMRTALAAVKSAEAEVADAELTLESKRQMWEDKVISDYDLALARTSLQKARATLEQARATEMNARNSLSYTRVASPADGVVGSIPYKVGALVSASMTTPLTTVSDNDSMHVYFSLPERTVREIILEAGGREKAIGSMDSLSLVMGDGTVYEEPGRVETMSGIVSQQTGTVQMRAVFSNSRHMLLSGSVGSVVMRRTVPKAVIIPQTAVMTIQDKSFVFVYSGGRVKQTAVSVRTYEKGKTYIVTEGLSGGESIIAKGVDKLMDGQEVAVATAPQRHGKS